MKSNDTHEISYRTYRNITWLVNKAEEKDEKIISKVYIKKTYKFPFLKESIMHPDRLMNIMIETVENNEIKEYPVFDSIHSKPDEPFVCFIFNKKSYDIIINEDMVPIINRFNEIIAN